MSFHYDIRINILSDTLFLHNCEFRPFKGNLKPARRRIADRYSDGASRLRMKWR